MTCRETQDLITALIDHELSDPERSSVEAHLKDCASCHRAYREEQALKYQIRAAAESLHAPVALKRRILSGRRFFLRDGAARKKWRELFRSPTVALRPALALGSLFLLALPAVYLMRSRNVPMAVAALEVHEKILAGESAFVQGESPEALVERLVRAVDGRFGPMGYDLSAMKLFPAGGVVRDVRGKKILAVIYKGPGGSLICYTFLGTEEDAPADANVFLDPAKEIKFHIFSRGRIHAVMHREGEKICILASEMPMKDLLHMVRAHARPA